MTDSYKYKLCIDKMLLAEQLADYKLAERKKNNILYHFVAFYIKTLIYGMSLI